MGLRGHSAAVPPITTTVRAKAAYKTLMPPTHPESSRAAIKSNSKVDRVNNVAAGG